MEPWHRCGVGSRCAVRSNNSLKPWRTTGFPVETSGDESRRERGTFGGPRLTRQAGRPLLLARPAGLPQRRGELPAPAERLSLRPLGAARARGSERGSPMPNAVVKLPNGTTVEIEGTEDEVQKLLAFYGLPSQAPKAKPTRKAAGTRETPRPSSAEGGTPTDADFAALVNLVRTCEEAEAIETQASRSNKRGQSRPASPLHRPRAHE